MDERELIRKIGDIIGQEQIQDDCAVIPHGGECLVLSTDMLHEKTDFPEGMTDWQVGWMAIAVTLSDIAAMGAKPTAILLAVGLDLPDRLEGIMQGAYDCCTKYGTALLGGDIDAHSELTLVSTCLGVVEPEHLVRRTGAQTGDFICITGTPGRAQAGLLGYEQHRSALLEPKPFVTEGQILGRAGITAMMDVSDGLALSLYDLLEVNDCGFSLYSEKIALLADVPRDVALECALFGGGDFGLLFTCPPDRYPVEGVEATIIGTVIPQCRVLLDGSSLEKRGYMHDWK